MDHESGLRALKPTLASWAELPNYHNTPYCTFETYLRVPSNYDAPKSGNSVRLHVQKYVNNSHVPPRAHVIFLAGGPGYGGEQREADVARWLAHFSPHPIACYTIDPRGVGKSGRFVPEGQKFEGFEGDLDCIVRKGPFPLTDLSLNTAALDAGMLAIALQTDGHWRPGARLIIEGSSYGSAVAHQSIKLLPFLYDGGVLEMIPQLKGLSAPGLIGLAEHCATDQFCRAFFPNHKDIWPEMQAAIKVLTQLDANECTRAFADFFDRGYFKKTDYAGRLVLLSMALQDTMAAKRLPAGFRPAQLILPLLKITKECGLSREEYIRKVLKPLKLHIDREHPGAAIWRMGVGDELNNLVNAILILDLEYYAGIPELGPNSPADLSIGLAFRMSYNKYYRSLAPHLAGYHFTDTRPLRTSHTRILIANSRLDFNTGYRQAWELYSALEAPEKYWLLLEHRQHTSNWTTCHAQVIGHLMGLSEERPQESALRDCLKKVNVEERLDWSFSKDPSLATLWGLISRKGPVSGTCADCAVPNVAIGSQSTASPLPVKPDLLLGPRATISQYGGVLNNQYFWLVTGALAVVALVIPFLTVAYYLRKMRLLGYNGSGVREEA